MISTDISQIKMVLRAKAREKRKEFVAARQGAAWTVPACADFGFLPDRGVPMASYRPVGSEADPAPVEEVAFRRRAFTCYPRIDADGLMRFYSLGASRQFVRSPLGFEQPATDGLLQTPALFLVPLLGFDRTGTRLGQGGGYYDRALAVADDVAAAKGWRLKKVGIAWSVQEMVDLPREAWDIRLDIIITEREWIEIPS
jgi:5-formyltetrahydrofolate cyclo-ligase